MVSKRERNHLMKAIHTASGKGKQQQQIQQQQQQVKGIVILRPDRFTEYKSIDTMLKNFALNARETEFTYSTHKKHMATSVALEIEDELKRMNKPELVCYICDELCDVLQQARVPWSRKYITKVLDERYKDPGKRANALQRYKREGPPGTPPDTGMTADELEASLNGKGKKVVGEYTVKHNMISRGKKPFKPIITEVKDGVYTQTMPVVIKVNASQQDARAWVDEEEYDKRVALGVNTTIKPQKE